MVTAYKVLKDGKLYCLVYEKERAEGIKNNLENGEIEEVTIFSPLEKVQKKLQK